MEEKEQILKRKEEEEEGDSFVTGSLGGYHDALRSMAAVVDVTREEGLSRCP